MSEPADVTQLLQDWSNGDQEALDRLLPSVYRDLQGIAHRHMVRERADHTLNTQALVHESYINLVDGARVGWRDRGHFFAVASRAMRRILIDHARKRGAKKRGGDQVVMTLNESMVSDGEGLGRLLAIDDALTELQKHDERLARVVECRFFAGLTVAETAEAMEQSPRTVERDWTRAKAYLKQALNGT
ncbi:MAG: sigma-70 family RNA polymerase sigma factor [Longimicrobiales bacterium]